MSKLVNVDDLYLIKDNFLKNANPNTSFQRWNIGEGCGILRASDTGELRMFNDIQGDLGGQWSMTTGNTGIVFDSTNWSEGYTQIRLKTWGNSGVYQFTFPRRNGEFALSSSTYAASLNDIDAIFEK